MRGSNNILTGWFWSGLGESEESGVLDGYEMDLESLKNLEFWVKCPSFRLSQLI